MTMILNSEQYAALNFLQRKPVAKIVRKDDIAAEVSRVLETGLALQTATLYHIDSLEVAGCIQKMRDGSFVITPSGMKAVEKHRRNFRRSSEFLQVSV